MQRLLTKGIGHEKFQDINLWNYNLKIPLSWKISTIGDIGANYKNSIVDGPFGSSIKQSDYLKSGVPLIRIKNITKDGQFNGCNFPYISYEKYQQLKRSALKENDILISRVGTIGNVCIFPSGYDKALLSTTGVCKITVNSDLISHIFLYYILRYNKTQNQLLKKCAGGVQKYFNLTALKSIKILLPPLEEQKQIASILSKVDEHIQDNKKELTHLQEVKKGLMQDLLTGKVRVSV